MSTTIAVDRPQRRSATVTRRVGVLLAVLQAAGGIALALSDFGSGFGALVAAVMIGCGVLVLALAVPVWLRAGRGTAVVVAVATLLSSLTGVPAFLIPGLPAAAVISAAVGIVLAIVTAVLLLVRPRG